MLRFCLIIRKRDHETVLSFSPAVIFIARTCWSIKNKISYLKFSQYTCNSDTSHCLQISSHISTHNYIGREPRPGLRMFSAKFFSLWFPDNLYRGPSQVCNDHSQLGAFCPQGAKTPLFGPKIMYIQILCHCDVRNRQRKTTFGRKYL